MKMGKVIVVVGLRKKVVKVWKLVEEIVVKESEIWMFCVGWVCVKNCGVCCVLDKGLDYLFIEEVFSDFVEVVLYCSMVGLDGWCINYDKFFWFCIIYVD